MIESVSNLSAVSKGLGGAIVQTRHQGSWVIEGVQIVGPFSIGVAARGLDSGGIRIETTALCDGQREIKGSEKQLILLTLEIPGLPILLASEGTAAWTWLRLFLTDGEPLARRFLLPSRS